MAATSYPIETNSDEFTRLRIQADLFRDDARAMLAQIGDGTGWRVLDLCCGIGGITDVLSEWVGNNGSVVGADIDAAKLRYARSWVKENKLKNVEFVEANAFDSNLPTESFDLVHSRFAISVIRDGIGILDHMLTLVRPEGVLFVEEANTHTMQCAPANDDWDTALDLMKRTFQVVGADTEMGLDLRAAFLERGLDQIAVKPCLHAQSSKDPMTLHLPMTLSSMAETISQSGLMKPEDLTSLVARLSDHLVKPTTLTISYSMIQVVGRRPPSSRIA